MSFLNQLRAEAGSLQRQRGEQHVEREQGIAATERACGRVLHYLEDLARHLNVIEPPAAAFSLDGKTLWPAMKLAAFRVDARRKGLGMREVIDTLTMGWDIVPQAGAPVNASIQVNFPPELERVETRLAQGSVAHERREVRHPEKHSLLAIRFDYLTQTRGSVRIAADHDQAQLAFRLVNPSGFGTTAVSWPADEVDAALLDELARLLLSQPSRFV